MEGADSYTAWDGQRYAGDAPDGWYMAADNRWWPNEEVRNRGVQTSEANHDVATLPPPPVSKQSSIRGPVPARPVSKKRSSTRSRLAIFGSGGIGTIVLFFVVAIPVALALSSAGGEAVAPPNLPDAPSGPTVTISPVPVTAAPLANRAQPVSEPGGGSAEILNCGWTEPRTASLTVTNSGAQATSFVITIAFDEVEIVSADTAVIRRRDVEVFTRVIDPGTTQEVRPFIDGEPRLNICRLTAIRPSP